MQVTDHAALVTGGGSGLGAETARLLAREGAKVAILDRDAEKGAAVAEEIGGFFAPCNVTDAEGAGRAIAACRDRNGAARILVNCAGIGGASRIVGRDGPAKLEDFARIVNVNLVGTFNMMRLAADDMSKLEPLDGGARGIVIMTASVAAFDGQIGQAAYAASKGGIHSLTLPAARELARFGIRVVTIAPGLFRTPLLQELPPEIQESLGKSIPFPARLGEAGEYAHMALSLIENGYINGETIRLDGALRMAPK